jgi:hypothetical protein
MVAITKTATRRAVRTNPCLESHIGEFVDPRIAKGRPSSCREVAAHLSEHNAHIHEIVVMRRLSSGAVFVSAWTEIAFAILQVRTAPPATESPRVFNGYGDAFGGRRACLPSRPIN